MYQNATFSTQKSKKILGGGTPPSQTSPSEEGKPLLHSHLLAAFGASVIAPSALNRHPQHNISDPALGDMHSVSRGTGA